MKCTFQLEVEQLMSGTYYKVLYANDMLHIDVTY